MTAPRYDADACLECKPFGSSGRTQATPYPTRRASGRLPRLAFGEEPLDILLDLILMAGTNVLAYQAPLSIDQKGRGQGTDPTQGFQIDHSWKQQGRLRLRPRSG